VRGTKGGLNDLNDGLAGVDVGDDLGLALGGVSSFSKKNDLRGLGGLARSRVRLTRK